MTHLQTAVAVRDTYEHHSPEWRAADAVIDALIEHATFDYALAHEATYRKAGTR